MQGFVCDTYKQAAILRGLLEDDTEWHRCLEEANTHAMPARLRELFASILHENAPAHPAALWDAFKGPMSEDILRSLRRVNDSASPLALLTYHLDCISLLSDDETAVLSMITTLLSDLNIESDVDSILARVPSQLS